MVGLGTRTEVTCSSSSNHLHRGKSAVVPSLIAIDAICIHDLPSFVFKIGEIPNTHHRAQSDDTGTRRNSFSSAAYPILPSLATHLDIFLASLVAVSRDDRISPAVAVYPCAEP